MKGLAGNRCIYIVADRASGAESERKSNMPCG